MAQSSGILLQRSQHRPAVEIGHDDVEDDRVRPLLLGKAQSLLAARRLDDAIAFGGERLGERLAHRRFVVDDQDGLAGMVLDRRGPAAPAQPAGQIRGRVMVKAEPLP